MPIVLFWAAPAVMLSGAGYYLMAVADLVDGAVALAVSPSPPRQRPQFKLIQGGKYKVPKFMAAANPTYLIRLENNTAVGNAEGIENG